VKRAYGRTRPAAATVRRAQHRIKQTHDWTTATAPTKSDYRAFGKGSAKRLLTLSGYATVGSQWKLTMLDAPPVGCDLSGNHCQVMWHQRLRTAYGDGLAGLVLAHTLQKHTHRSSTDMGDDRGL
jgi:hypothetical protein